MSDDKCPCACECHAEIDGCDHPVTDEQRALETLGDGGRYICGFCWSTCEGDE